MVDRKHTTD